MSTSRILTSVALMILASASLFSCQTVPAHLEGNVKTSAPQAGKIQVLVRSDDMGATHATNLACLKTVTEGIARSIEVLVPAPWFKEAAMMLKKHPQIDVGVHLDLTSEWDYLKWGPVSQNVPSIVDASGHFYPMTSQRKDFPPNTGFLECGWKIEEVEKELRSQIELALKELPKVTHMTAHMGTATSHPKLRTMVNRLAEEYKLPIDLPNAKRPPRFTGNTLSKEQKEEKLIEILKGLKPGLWLFVVHPAHDTLEMKPIGHKGYRNVGEDREGDTFAITSPKVKKVIEELGIELVSYADVLKKTE